MVDELETGASNYDVRAMLAEARTNAWNGRVSELSGPHDGIEPMDSNGMEDLP